MRTLSMVTLVVATAAFTFSGCADKPNPIEGAVNEPVADGSALGKATVLHSNAVYPLDLVLTGLAPGCIEGSLHLTGEIHVVTQMVLDETGTWKLKTYHDNWEGVTAVTESGVVYKVIRVRNWPRVTGQGAWEATFVDVVRLIGPAGETGALIKTHNHLTWTPNGDVSVEFYNTSIECK